MILEYALKNWKELLLVALFAFLYIKSTVDMSTLQRLQEERSIAYEESLKEMKDNYENRIQKREKDFEEYKENVASIVADFEKEIQRLNSTRIVRVKEYENILKEKPETLINEMEEKFGFEYVE